MIYVFYFGIFFIFPIFIHGLVNRVKAIWAGRKGFPLMQLGYDLIKLARKRPVYSSSSSWVIRSSGVVLLATTIAAGLVAPVFPKISLISFQYDFIFFAYVLTLGRIFLILGALDTASSFEGMGASREAIYSALIEPTLFICLVSLCLLSKSSTLSTIVSIGPDLANDGAAIFFCLIALFILVQTESSRVPVDDPNTHLELTMIHEVMVLDHSAGDLALIQYGSAMKLTILVGLMASLLNPFSFEVKPLETVAVALMLMIGIAIALALAECLIARIRLRSVPFYVGIAMISSILSFFISYFQTWGRG